MRSIDMFMISRYFILLVIIYLSQINVCMITNTTIYNTKY